MNLFQRIAGGNSGEQQTFTTALGSTTPYSAIKVKEAISTLNNKRKQRLMLLLDYIEDQGWLVSKFKNVLVLSNITIYATRKKL